MKHNIGRLLLACILAGLTAASASAGGKQHNTPAGKAKSGAADSTKTKKAKHDEPGETLRLRFDVLELHLSPEEVNRLNASTEACDVAALVPAVIERGDGRVKYSLGGPVALSRAARMVVGHRVPFVRGTRVSDTGQTNTRIEYENVGCELKLTPHSPEKALTDAVVVSFRVEISALIPESTVEVGANVKTPLFSSLRHEFTARVPLGTDTYFWSLTGVDEARAIAPLVHVYRVRFDPTTNG